MAEGTFKINEEWFARQNERWMAATDNFLAEMAATASSVAPKGKSRTSAPAGKSRRRTGTATEFTVDVEFTPQGPRIPKGSRTNAAASRAIRARREGPFTTQEQFWKLHNMKRSSFKKIGPNLYQHTFQRRGFGGTRKTLAGSMKVISTESSGGGGKQIVGYVKATVRYALWVHLGKSPHGSRTPQPFFTWTLGAHFDDIQTGKFLKR